MVPSWPKLAALAITAITYPHYVCAVTLVCQLHVEKVSFSFEAFLGFEK
jgi:hypothetical protein